MVFICSENRFCNKSLIKYREINIANVAPIVLANETITVPLKIPKIAPPARVKIVAPGRENEVIRVYTTKKINKKRFGFASYIAVYIIFDDLRFSRVKKF